MSASVLATGRAFSSQSAREISRRADCRQAARARARIQQKSARASSQISEFRSCMHSVSWIHARAGGWEAAHAMEWARLPGRGGLPIMFEKSAERKLKCAHRLRFSGSARAAQKLPKHIGLPAASISLILSEKHCMYVTVVARAKLRVMRLTKVSTAVVY